MFQWDGTKEKQEKTNGAYGNEHFYSLLPYSEALDRILVCAHFTIKRNIRNFISEFPYFFSYSY